MACRPHTAPKALTYRPWVPTLLLLLPPVWQLIMWLECPPFLLQLLFPASSPGARTGWGQLVRQYCTCIKGQSELPMTQEWSHACTTNSESSLLWLPMSQRRAGLPIPQDRAQDVLHGMWPKGLWPTWHSALHCLKVRQPWANRLGLRSDLVPTLPMVSCVNFICFCLNFSFSKLGIMFTSCKELSDLMMKSSS